MSSYSTEISVSARYAELPRLIGEACSIAASEGMNEADIGRLQVVLEEVFTNTITHGYREECDVEIRVGIKRDEACVSVSFIDSAPPFDLTQCQAATAEAENIGGLGIALIQGMTQAIRYERQGAFNITEFDF